MPLFGGKTPEPTGPAPLIAAAQEVHLSDADETMEVWLSRQPWQERVYNYYDEVGEVRFSTKFVGNSLSKIRLVASEWEGDYPEEGEVPVPSTNKDVKEAVGLLRAKRGGQGQLLRSLAQNLFLVGESWLVGHADKSWEALSISELQVRPNEKLAYRKVLPALPPKKLATDDLLVRVWQEHPKWSALADSGFRTVLGECEKLLLLSRADRAAARSRFAGRGLLFIPNELVPPVQQPSARGGQNSGPVPGSHPVLDALTTAMIEPVKDESHPSSVVPVVLMGPGEQGSNIKYITFDATADKQATQKREEARGAIAVAIDLPADVLSGKSDTNHWNAWLIREETFQQHLQPFVELICNALTVGYLQPALERAGVKDVEKYVIWYDDSRLVARPNRAEAADVGIQTPGPLSHAAWRRERGFTEDDAPSDKEYAQRVGVSIGDGKMAVTGTPTEEPAPTTPTAAKPEGAIPKEVHPRGTTDDQPAAAKTKPPGASKVAPITSAASAPDGAGARVGRALAQLDVNLMQRVRIAASEVMTQALNRAGARVRSRVKDKGQYQELLANVPNAQVARVLGPATLESLELAPAELTHDAFAGFGGKVDGWFRQAQQQRNRLLANFASAAPVVTDKDLSDQARRDKLDAEYGEADHDDRGLAVGLLIAGLTTLAASKLFGDDGEPATQGELDQLEVPAALVREAVETAGGGGGVGVGTRTQEIMTDLGVITTGWEWVYGPWERSQSFQGHEDLDGVAFGSPTDDVLAVQPGDEWLGREFYAVGDHRGCLCQRAPILDDGTTDDTGEPLDSA